MPIIFDSSDRPRFVGPVTDFCNVFDDVLCSMHKDMKCPNCGKTVRVPIIATARDAEIIYKFIDVLTNYIDDHPDIAYELIVDLVCKWQKMMAAFDRDSISDEDDTHEVFESPDKTFCISYNCVDSDIYGGPVTALVLYTTKKVYILNGDHRSEYQSRIKNGLEDCMTYFKSRIRLMNGRSDIPNY